jgi:hypothetical protein
VNTTRTPKGSARPAKPVGNTDDQREIRRRQLLADQCVKLGVRFLPAQVMRSIYEREGLL